MPSLKPKPSDIDFLMRTLVYSLVFLALLHTFKPYFSESSAADRAQIEQLARSTKSITVRELEQYLERSNKPTFLMVYASWCGYCKKQMPLVYELWNEGKIPGDQMLMLSVDKSTTDLAAYIFGERFEGMLGSPVLLAPDLGPTLSQMLQKHGSTYDGGIPYVGIFAPGGKRLTEIIGGANKSDLDNAVKALQ